MAFIVPLLASLLMPAIVIGILGADLRQPGQLILDHVGTAFSILLSASSLGFLLYVTLRLLRAILQTYRGARNAMAAIPRSVWGFPVLTLSVVFAMSISVVLTWVFLITDQGKRLRILFTSLRSLDLLSGVSPLVPLFLISLAGFIWSLVSYHRRGNFEPAADYVASPAQGVAPQSLSGFLPLKGLSLERANVIECEVRRRIECSPLWLPGYQYVLGSVFFGGCFIFFVFVHELEETALYWLLGVSFLLVSAVLWLGVLRFWCVWSEVQRLLKYVASTPLHGVCKRFRKTYPIPLKLDLASPVPGLSAWSHYIESAIALHVQAKGMIAAQPVAYQVASGSGGGSVSAGSVPATASIAGYSGLLRLASPSFNRRARVAEVQLQFAQKEHATHNKSAEAFFQWACGRPLAAAASTISSVVDGWWSRSQRPPGDVCEMAELFLLGRLVHFLGYVLPQLQQMIAASVAGVLLLLLAVNSYPFPPHNILVWLNWAVVLTLVAIALGVFIQMNRDPVLSQINGTTPGKINWDREFILRVFTYGVIPIVALLGAQFPDSIGHILSYFRMGEGVHQ
jgi:hypothetical protein